MSLILFLLILLSVINLEVPRVTVLSCADMSVTYFNCYVPHFIGWKQGAIRLLLASLTNKTCGFHCKCLSQVVATFSVYFGLPHFMMNP